MLSKNELQAIAGIIQNLDFYRVLKVPSHASEEDVRSAFHQEALHLHPDQYRAVRDPEVIALVKLIYSRVVAAYRTLSQTERRTEYDRGLKTKAIHSAVAVKDIDDDKNEITAVRSIEKSSTTNAGQKFFKLARTAFQNRDMNSARMNIQIALNTDSKNPEFLDLASRIDSEIARKKR